MKYPALITIWLSTERIACEVWRSVSTVVLKLKLRGLKCSYGKGLRADGRVFISCRRPGYIRLGEGVKINSRFSSNLVGLTQPVIFQCLENGRIEIGDHAGLSGTVLSVRTAIVIGRHAKLGGNVRIYDHDYHSLDWEKRCTAEDGLHVKSRPVKIGDHVFVGVNSIILKGVTIGDRAIIGAGSVVGCNVPADEIWAGNPARFIKSLKLK
jgi:acetyltransferase-like isoleucine patch superfamily enzyme